MPAAYTSGSTYTVEHTPPSVSSINRVGSSPNNASSDQFTVTFSDFLGAVTGVSAGLVNRVGGEWHREWFDCVGQRQRRQLHGDGQRRDRQRHAGIESDQLRRRHLRRGGQQPRRLRQPEAYTIERIRHRRPVASINIVGSSPNNASSDQFIVTFSDFLGAVSGVSAASLALAETGTAGGSIASVSGSGDSYTR